MIRSRLVFDLHTHGANILKFLLQNKKKSSVNSIFQGHGVDPNLHWDIALLLVTALSDLHDTQLKYKSISVIEASRFHFMSPWCSQDVTSSETRSQVQRNEEGVSTVIQIYKTKLLTTVLRIHSIPGRSEEHGNFFVRENSPCTQQPIEYTLSHVIVFLR